jgi:predicted SprT family Zn-dependent metalloprotease
MVITILAIAFLALIVFAAVFGYNSITRKVKDLGQTNTEKCSICRKVFDKDKLIERQVGDYKLMYFCRECILNLVADAGTKD